MADLTLSSDLDTFLGAASFAAARTALGVPGLAGANTFSGAATFSANGAASTSAISITGIPFAGTGTTAFPLVYVNETGATASTTLTTTGTLIGVNGNGTSDLMNLLKDGTSQFKVSSVGVVTVASYLSAVGVDVGAVNALSFGSRCRVTCPVDGSIRLTNNAQTDFTNLQFGGTTASFPAIKRNAAALNFRVADDTADCAVTALSYQSAAPAGGTSGVWKLGVAATVTPTSPNRTIELDIGGTIYYLHAKTTNN